MKFRLFEIMPIYLFLQLFVILFQLNSENLPKERLTDWSNAGISNEINREIIYLESGNLHSNGNTANDEFVQEILETYKNQAVTLIFPSGRFLFNKTIELSSNIEIIGQGAENTELIFDLGGKGNAIEIKGDKNTETQQLIKDALRNSNHLLIEEQSTFNNGDFILISKNDLALVTSDWAKNSVVQICQIDNIIQDTIFLKSKLRTDFMLNDEPKINKLSPIENVSIKCLKINRIDKTSPQQTSNILFRYAVNSQVYGIESTNCNFSHIEAEFSSNLLITSSYFHHAHEYGGGGRAYGVMLHFGTGEVLVENNIFEHLRHSMIVQAGANGNVFAYNYSLDPYWTDTALPSNSAGDMVLHGNYVHSNLFEGNICQNIVIDNSHGPNGPFNTFFRNRAELFGIFFSANNSPKQNIIGNEITNNSIPYSIVNYTILGSDHFIYGNNNKGTIHPEGTNSLDTKSLFYDDKPYFLDEIQFSGIGIPNDIESITIPAYERYENDMIFNGVCDDINSVPIFQLSKESIVYPNPIIEEATFKFNNPYDSRVVIEIYNIHGTKITTLKDIGINEISWNLDDDIDSGIYFAKINIGSKAHVIKLFVLR